MLIDRAAELRREGKLGEGGDRFVAQTAAGPDGRGEERPSLWRRLGEVQCTNRQTNEVDREGKSLLVDLVGPGREGVPEALQQSGCRHRTTCR